MNMVACVMGMSMTAQYRRAGARGWLLTRGGSRSQAHQWMARHGSGCCLAGRRCVGQWMVTFRQV